MDPLPGLDGLPRASLHGTYRTAEDMPGWIEALRSSDHNTRHDALDSLWGAAVHQGTRWQVSAHVVPFLVTMLPFDPDIRFGGVPMVTKEQEDLVIERRSLGGHRRRVRRPVGGRRLLGRRGLRRRLSSMAGRRRRGGRIAGGRVVGLVHAYRAHRCGPGFLGGERFCPGFVALALQRLGLG